MALAAHSGGGGSNTKPKTTKRETPVTTSPTTMRSPSSVAPAPAPAAAPAASTIKVPKPTFGQRVGNAINSFANKLVQSNPNIGKSSGVDNASTWAGLVNTPATSSKPTTSVGQAFKPATTQTTKPAAATNPGQIQIAKPPKVGASNESSYTFLTPGGSGASAVSKQDYTAKFNENADDYIGTMKRIFNGVGDQNGIDDPDFLHTQLSNGDALIAELEKNPNGFDKDYIERSIASIQNSNNLIRERLMILQLASSPNPEVSSKAQEIIEKYANYDPMSNVDETTGKLKSKYEPANADWVLKTVAGTAPRGNRGTSSVISSVLESSTMSPKDKYNAILKSYQTDWASFEKVPKETGLDSYLTWQDETYKLLGEDYAASAEYIQNFADQLIEEYGVGSDSEEIQQLRGIAKSYEAMAKGATLDDFFNGFADEHEFNQWYLAEAAKGNNRDDFVGFDVDKVRNSITDIENRIAIKQQELNEVRSSSKGFGKSGMESVPKIQELENELLTLKDRRDDYNKIVSAYETAKELDTAIDSSFQYQEDVDAKTDELIKLEDAAAKSKAAFDKARMITREGLTAQEFLELEQKAADDAAAVDTARKELSHMHEMQALATSGLSRDAAVLSTLSAWTDNRTFGQQVSDWTKATKADLKEALTDGTLSWKDLGTVAKNAAVNAYNIADLRLVQTMDFLVGEDSPLTGHGTAIGKLRQLGSTALKGLGVETRFADDDRIGYFAEQVQKDQAAIEQNRKNIENAVSGNKTIADIANLLSDTFSCAFDLIPMTVMAVATGGASAAPTLAAGTTEYLTYVSSINTGSELSRMATIMTQDLAATAKNPMYWTSFASVAGPSYQDALDQGLSKDVAATYALINSAINAKIEIGGGLEAFPEKIRDGVYKTEKGFWAASLDIVKELFTESGFDEAKEEIWQGAAERALMAAAKGDNLTWTDTGEEHTTALFSTTAQDAIINPKLMAKEAGTGYLGGVLLGGGQQILNGLAHTGSEAMLNNRFAQEYNTIEKQQQFIADSKYLGNTSEKVMAADAQLNPKEETATAKQLSGKELLAIARENEKASSEAKVGLAAKRMGLSTEDIETIKRDFANSDARETNKFIKGMADMYRWATLDGEIESASRYLTDTDYLSNEAKSHIYNMGQKVGNPDLNLTKTETLTVGNITGTITGLKTVGNELRVQLTDAEGNVREVAVSGETMPQLPKAIQDLWKEFGDKAGMLYEAYDPSISFRQYRNDVRALMSAASNSTQSWTEFSQTEGAAKLAPSLSPELKQRLWDSVQKTNRHTAVTKSQITRANKAADRTENEVQAGEVKGKNFSVTLKDAKGKDIHIDLAKYQVTKAQKGSKEAKALKVAEAAAKVFGINIYLYNAPNSGIAGAFVGEDTIYLNMQDVDAKGDYIIMKSLSHELTHFIQKNSIRDYIALKNFMVEKLLQKTEGMTYEQLLQDKINREGLTGPDAIARAEDEIVADGCEMMLKNSKMFEELATQNMTLAKRIQKWLNNIKRSIQELYGDQSATFEEAEYMKQFIEEQQKLWDRGLKNAVLNRDAQRKAEAKKNNASAFQAATTDARAYAQNPSKEQTTGAQFSRKDTTNLEIESIKEQIANHQDELEKMEPVVNVTVPTDLRTKPEARRWAIKYLQKYGYQVDRQDYGKIFFDPDDINKGINYADTAEEKAAIAALPMVLKRGIQIGEHIGHKNRKKDTITFGAPVVINGERGNMGVVVNKRGNHYYTHRIVLPDGASFKFSEKNNAAREPSRGVATNSSLAKTTSAAIEKIAQTSEEVKSYSSAKEFIAPEAKPVNETKAATSEDVTIVTEKGRQYSIRSMRHDIADGKMFEDLKAYVGYSNKDINKLKQDLTALTNYMAQYADILDMNETYTRDNRPYKPYKPNSDKLYVLSLDFSTLCRKRLLTQHVMEELQTTLTDSKTGKLGRVLTAEEQLAIRDMLNEYAKQEKALKVACAMCYVEAARMKSPVQIEKALSDMRGLMVDYFAKRSPTFKKHIAELQAQWKADHGYDRDATKKSMKSKDQTAFNKYSHEQRALYQPTAEEAKIIDAAVAMPRTTFLKASNLTELAETYPDIYTAYTNKLREATHSKGLETDIPYYYGDSKGVVSDSFIQAVNDENGMRFSSWSDFQMKHMLDMMTAVIELSTRKCAMHGYTKFLEQVRIFGKTGMMFNMSGVPSGNGFTADGGLAFSPTESVLVYGQDNEYDAVAAREQFPETAGLQCIGISNAHIKALLDSDIIDYVIPYHTSGMNAGLRKMAGINNWSDFQGFQEAKIDDRIKPADSANYDEATWHKEPVFSEFFNAALDEANGYTKEEDGVTTMRRAADLYKQMCRDRGMKPKFSWGNSRVDADFSNEANYWKLLIDRKMINQKTGELIQQKPVRPDFDFDAITKEVKAEVDSYDAGLETKALDYIKEHLDELPNRVRDLKKSGTVKKLEAQTKPADMQRHLDNLFNSMMTSDTGTQEDIRYSLIRQFPNERSFLDAYRNRRDEVFEGYVLSPAQERMVIPKIRTDDQADYYNNLPKYAEDIAAGMIPFVPGDAIPDYDRSLIKYSSEWYKKNGLPIPAKRTPYVLFEPTVVDDGSVVERDELPFSIVPQHERTAAEQLIMDRNALAAQEEYFRNDARVPDINRKVRPTLRNETEPASEPAATPTPADVGTHADVGTPAHAGARTDAHVGETQVPGRQKQSKFASNTLEGMNIWDEIGGRENTMDRNGEFLYNEVTERESMDAARQRLEADWGYWERDLMGEYTSPTADREWTGKDLDTAMAIFRQKRIDANRNQDENLTPEERYADVDAWLQRIREKATAGGQLIQAFAKYSRTPEGVLIQAGRDLAANNKLTRDQRNEILNKMINFAMTLDALREAGDTGDNSSLIELIKQQAEMRGTPVSQRIENGLRKEQFQYLYDVALTQLAQIAADYRPNSIGKKLSTYQTIAHLLNLRTGTRNVVANMAFRTVDRIANMIAAPMDAFVGKITGNRTVGWKQLGRLSGEVRKTEHERGRRASIEASLDVDPYNGKDKYGTSRRTWKMKDGPGARVMSTLEKWMAYELNVTDEISKGIILGEVMESLSPFIENNLLSEDEAVAMAKQEMLYRTFQDDNWANGLLGAIKNALNVIGTGSTNGKMIGSLPVHDFGLGDIVTKYVQVPGSLIMRMIEYSPVGTIKAVADMANIFTAYNQLSRSNTLEDAKQTVADLRQQLAEAKAAGEDTAELKAQLKEATSNYKDVKSRTGDIRAKAFLKDQGQYTKSKVAINNEQARMNALQAQRRAMLQLGRSLTGSGLIALFAALAKAGLLRRDDDDEDKDIRALNTSAGLSGTQLNLSALMRAASGESNWSEWLDGDKLMDIGFLEPLNGLMTIGAIVAKNNDDLISRDTMNDTLAGLMENIAELPVMQTLGTIQSSIQNLQYDAESENATQSIAKDVMSVAIDVARSSASGFIPAPVRQAAQATDEYARDMYQGDTGAEKFVDSLKSSIPGLRQTLPQKLDNFGNPRTTENDPFTRAMNAFINPGNLRTYRSADLTNELNRLYDATGKSGILPKRYAPYSINEGPGYQLTADEKRVYQVTRGQTADNLLRDLFSSQAYQTATDEQRAEWAKDVVSYADYVAKQEFLNNRNYLDEKGEGYSSRAKEEMKEALAKGVPLDTYLKYVDAIDRRYTVATYDYEARNETLEAEYRAGNINDEQFIQLYDYTTNSSDTTPEKLTAASEAGIAPPDYLVYKAEINNNPDFNRTKANYGKSYDTANKKAVSAYIWSVAKTDEQAEILWLLRYKESTINKLYQYKPKS